MQPKTVVARLIAAHHRRRSAQLLLGPHPHLPDQRQQTNMIAAGELVPRHAVPVGGHGSSPASCVDSVRSPRKSCQYDPWWACIGWMLASDLSDGSSGITRTYRMHAHRPMESTLRVSDLG